MEKRRLLDDYMTEPELLEELGIHGATLRRWLTLGIAPPRTMLGRRPYYNRDDVKTWLKTSPHNDKNKIKPAVSPPDDRGTKYRRKTAAALRALKELGIDVDALIGEKHDRGNAH